MTSFIKKVIRHHPFNLMHILAIRIGISIPYIRAVEMIISFFLKLLPYSLSKVVIVFGVPRSGTTWVGERIAAGGHFRTLFEPLHLFHNPHAEGLRSALKKMQTDSHFSLELRTQLRKVLFGNYFSFWTSKSGWKLFAKDLLIKEVRIAYLLGLVREIRPDARIIILLRHPFSVALSQHNCGWAGKYCILNASNIYCHVAEKWVPELTEYRKEQYGILESVIFNWYSAYATVFRQLNPPDYYTVCYEELLKNPAAGFSSLFEYCGLSQDSHRFNDFQKPSTTVTSSPKVKTPEEAFTPESLIAGRALLQSLGIDLIYTNPSTVTQNGLNAFRNHILQRFNPLKLVC